MMSATRIDQSENRELAIAKGTRPPPQRETAIYWRSFEAARLNLSPVIDRDGHRLPALCIVHRLWANCRPIASQFFDIPFVPSKKNNNNNTDRDEASIER